MSLSRELTSQLQDSRNPGYAHLAGTIQSGGYKNSVLQLMVVPAQRGYPPEEIILSTETKLEKMVHGKRVLAMPADFVTGAKVEAASPYCKKVRHFLGYQNVWSQPFHPASSLLLVEMPPHENRKTVFLYDRCIEDLNSKEKSKP